MRRTLIATIDLFPLVVVVFVLLLFFIVVTPVHAPSAGSWPVSADPPLRARAAIDHAVVILAEGTRDGWRPSSCWIDKQRAAPADFPDLVRRAATGGTVSLAVDRRLTMGDAKHALRLLRDAGFERVFLVVYPAAGDPGQLGLLDARWTREHLR